MFEFWRFCKSSPPQTPEERAMIDAYLREFGALRVPPAYAFGADALITKAKIIEGMFAALRGGTGRVLSNSRKDAGAAYGAKLRDDLVEGMGRKREA